MDNQSYYNILMNFKKTDSEAERLERLVRQMKALSEEQMSGTIRNTDQNWRSEAASDYIRKCDRLKYRVEETAKELKKAAESIRTIAGQTQEAEMKALEALQMETEAIS